jgi:UDP-N-acetyl-D-glucosamine dehydrogenase
MKDSRTDAPVPDGETDTARRPAWAPTYGVLGLGYVGLPTALALVESGRGVIGIDVSQSRLDAIAEQRVDLTASDLQRLHAINAEGLLATTTDPGHLGQVDVVLICVPTPVDPYQVPDHSFVRAACAEAVAHAREGQLIVLTSTTSVGTTKSLLTEPLERAGFVVGRDVFVAFRRTASGPPTSPWPTNSPTSPPRSTSTSRKSSARRRPSRTASCPSTRDPVSAVTASPATPTTSSGRSAGRVWSPRCSARP